MGRRETCATKLRMQLTPCATAFCPNVLLSALLENINTITWLQVHPDKTGGAPGSQSAASRLNNAYQTLSDAAARR